MKKGKDAKCTHTHNASAFFFCIATIVYKLFSLCITIFYLHTENLKHYSAFCKEKKSEIHRRIISAMNENERQQQYVRK